MTWVEMLDICDVNHGFYLCRFNNSLKFVLHDIVMAIFTHTTPLSLSLSLSLCLGR